MSMLRRWMLTVELVIRVFASLNVTREQGVFALNEVWMIWYDCPTKDVNENGESDGIKEIYVKFSGYETT